MNTAVVRALALSVALTLAFLGFWWQWGGLLSDGNLPMAASSLDRLETHGAPNFELPWVDHTIAKRLNFFTMKGKPVILNFWATWCAPCVTEFPSMLKMASHFNGKVAVVTISADERRDDVLAFLKSFDQSNENVIHLYDPTFETAKAFGTEKLPETYIFDSNLKLAKKLVSALDWEKKEVIDYITKLVQ